MDHLTRVLYSLSGALLVPVVVLLLALVGMSVVYFGGMLYELWQRLRYLRRFRQLVEKLRQDAQAPFDPQELPPLCGLPGLAFCHRGADAQKTLDDLQLRAERALAQLTFGVRLGPILGLAGTLIPLGPALVALSQGDIATLSAKLVVAFTTTVLGLLVGGLCFAMHLVRRHWYMQDLSDIEFLFKRMEPSHATPSHPRP